MSAQARIATYIDKVSNVSEYVNTSLGDSLATNLQNLTKTLYEYGQHEKSYKKSHKKSRNLGENELVTDSFGDDEIWAQIKDRSSTLLSTVDQRSKYRQNEREKMQEILNELQKDVVDDEDSGSDVDVDVDDELAQLDEEDDTDADEDGNDDAVDPEGAKMFLDSLLQKEDGSSDNAIEAENAENDAEAPEDEDEEDNGDEQAANGDDGGGADDDDDLDMATLEKRADDLDAFMDKQWQKEQQAAQNGDFDLQNADMFQRALMLEEEEEEEEEEDENKDKDDNDDEGEQKGTSSDHDDDFAFLKQHIADDDEAAGDGDSNNEEEEEEEEEATDANGGGNGNEDEWNDLFNLPKFAAGKHAAEVEQAEQRERQKQLENEQKLEQEMTEQNLSKFELEERAIRQRIETLEEDNMKPRSWELQGEVSNNKFLHPNIHREKNSLLSTYVDFDYSDKLKPTITDELNHQIETLLVARIKSDDFDDVERKRDFVNAPKVAKRKLVEIQDTKSSMGLAELYEREYLQQIETKNQAAAAANGDEDFTSSKDVDLQRKYELVSRLKSTLFYELDQLVRFHYEPKPAVVSENIKVKTYTKAMHLEEALPFAVSTANTMTPEQLYRKPRKFAHLKGENEMTKEDRKRKRRANKERGKHWKMMKEEAQGQRAVYDAKFSQHLNRAKALNEVRTHAMAAAKKDGFLQNKSMANLEMDNTNWTSSKQMFERIQQNKDASDLKKKRKNMSDKQGKGNKGNNNPFMQKNEKNTMPPEKKRKIINMLH